LPRQARLDAPGLLQHVMARGIERTKVFRDDEDRESFLSRFADVLESTQTQCYAWALVPNHFHALLRTGTTPLSKVMRRLMTGYAVSFNRRYKRRGHLFQNRYKSIVCEEDPYLLELLRYIHLNPVRAGMVKDMKGLDDYPWTGHSVVLGRSRNPLIPQPANPPTGRNKSFDSLTRRPFDTLTRAPVDSLAEKTIEDVLLHFGDSVRVARRRYREFVEKGVAQGRREDLQGGGLVRSAGGDKGILSGRKKEERENGDERVLGSGDFVNEALSKAGAQWEQRKKPGMSMEALIERVGSCLDVKTESILSSKCRGKASEARSLICHLAVNGMGYSTSDAARALWISRVNAGRCALRGAGLVEKHADLSNIGQ
jgi:putative transposase